MEDKCKNLFHEEGIINSSSSTLAIIYGLLSGSIILFASNPGQTFYGFMVAPQGGFTDGVQEIGQMLYLAIPIIMTGLSVELVFKTGPFNVGSSGQFTAGALTVVFMGAKFISLPAGVHCLIAFMTALLAGAIWGFVPGFLKVSFNINEMITFIMMNYISMYPVNMLIQKAVYDQVKNQTFPVAAGANLPKAGLDRLFPGTNINAGILIAILFVILIYIIPNKATFEYELKTCGKNLDASKYAGINEKRNIVLSMVITGVLSGTDGAPSYLASSGKYMQVLNMIAPEGLPGVSVAPLRSSNPVGTLFARLFIGHIIVGGYDMQLFNFVPEMIDIIIAAVIYCGVLSLLSRTPTYKIQMRKSKKSEAGKTAGIKDVDGAKKQESRVKTGKEGTR